MPQPDIICFDSKPLTKRELQLVQLLAEGKTTKEIATVLDVACSTIASHRKHICNKIGAHSSAELIAYACRISSPVGDCATPDDGLFSSQSKGPQEWPRAWVERDGLK